MILNLYRSEDDQGDCAENERNGLVAYPAQCNFSGYKYPLDWITKIQHGHLDSINKLNRFYVQPQHLPNSSSSSSSSHHPKEKKKEEGKGAKENENETTPYTIRTLDY